jgi:hypothetical protein
MSDPDRLLARVQELRARQAEKPSTPRPAAAMRRPPTPPTHVVCMAGSPHTRRHLQPVADAGGWQFLRHPLQRDVEGTLCVVCSVSDEDRAVRAGAAAVVLMEHGAGLSYTGLPPDNPWSGGRGLGMHRALFLAPGPEIAGRHAAAHPEIPVEIVGPVALDTWHGVMLQPHSKPVVCISTHWDCHVLPETRSAWPWIWMALPAIAASEQWELVGHFHPHENRTGVAQEKRRFFADLGVRVIEDFADVLVQADLFVSDNSSTLYEFAATGRPVLCLNPPWYRRDVQHGLRFWEAVPGLECDQPAELGLCIERALGDLPWLRKKRAAAVQACYGDKLDGGATARAVDAIARRFWDLTH